VKKRFDPGDLVAWNLFSLALFKVQGALHVVGRIGILCLPLLACRSRLVREWAWLSRGGAQRSRLPGKYKSSMDSFFRRLAFVGRGNEMMLFGDGEKQWMKIHDLLFEAEARLGSLE
jgi:hypothetical protein